MGTEIFREHYDGGWEKIIIQRSDGKSTDAYVNHPSSGKRFRSSNDLLKFVQDNPSILKRMDPNEVNFNKNPGKPPSAAVKKFIEAIEKLQAADPDEVSKMTEEILAAKGAPKEPKEKKPRVPGEKKPRKEGGSGKGPVDFKCSICKKSFERSLVGKIRMKKHMKKRHDVDPSSSSYDDFKKGLSAKPSSEPPELKCEKCGKRWKNNSDNRQRLRFHMKKRHDVILPKSDKDKEDSKSDVKKSSSEKPRDKDRDKPREKPREGGPPREDVWKKYKPGPKSKREGDNDNGIKKFKIESDEEEEEEKPKQPETVFKNPFFKNADNDSDDSDDELMKKKMKESMKDSDEEDDDKPSLDKSTVFVNPFFKTSAPAADSSPADKKEEAADPEKSPEFHWSESDSD